MTRLIVKSPYIKGAGVGGYLKYIGTREGVELLPSGYMEYMAKRPRSHGLFGDEGSVDMNAVIKELNEYPGSIWTHIISLKREDADRLGYNHAAQWRNMLRAHRNEIAEAMHIPPSDFRWYAAFHDEGEHPHVHMMAWSVKPGQAYLSRDGIRKIKSVLTNDIFKQEMLHTYEQKSVSRNELVRQARETMKTLVNEMQQSIGDHPKVESLIMTLVTQLEAVTGKKKYGYLPKGVKKTVDEIVDQVEQLPVIDECYQAWWKLQCQIEDFYSEKERQRPPLSEQKEFRSIKNVVIQEAESIRMGTLTFEDTGATEESEADALSALPHDCWELWTITQDSTAPIEDRDESAAQLVDMAESGDPDAQYLIGKLYQDGPVLIPDSVEARYWFEQSAQQDHVAAQCELGKLLLSDDPEVRDPALGIQWLEYAVYKGSNYAAYRLGKEYLKGQIVEKDTNKAVKYLTQSAKAGNQYAQYALGKLYLEKHDQEQARYWFTQSATQGNEYAQFFLDRWDSLKSPSAMLSVTRLLHHMSRVFQEQMPTPSVPGGIQIDRKRLAKIREKKIAMGHKADDHEEQAQNWTMTMG
ncbi:MAG: relaxase MobL [Oscillospiraceae bacterium]|nr:relaxase MobL [Oscillospiraceae bacterium]